MSDDPRARADARLEAALEGGDRLDPRPMYRPVLRYIKEQNPEAFRRALRYYDEELVPGSVEGDPLAAWLEYGARLSAELGPGRLLDIDATGRARPIGAAAAGEGFVLFLPDSTVAPALVLRYPGSATTAQRAAMELLVEGRQTASAYD